MTSDLPFWKTTSLHDMSPSQWESLCDGCGRCCLNKLRDDETDEIVWTSVSCRLLDTETCRCKDYERRQKRMPDCITLTPHILNDIDWLPPSCAYRLIRDGFDLPEWHPLISGTHQTVKAVGASAEGKCISERYAGMLEDHIAHWPGEWPEHAPVCITSKPKKSR